MSFVNRIRSAMSRDPASKKREKERAAANGGTARSAAEFLGEDLDNNGNGGGHSPSPGGSEIDHSGGGGGKGHHHGANGTGGVPIPPSGKGVSSSKGGNHSSSSGGERGRSGGGGGSRPIHPSLPQNTNPSGSGRGHTSHTGRSRSPPPPSGADVNSPPPDNNGAATGFSPTTPNLGGATGGGGVGNLFSGVDIPTTQTILANPIAQPGSENGANGGGGGPLSRARSIGGGARATSDPPTTSASRSQNDVSPLSQSVGPGVGGSGGGSGSGGAGGPNQFDIDDLLNRLLSSGYSSSSKPSKSPCLKNSEITAICLAAREVFLSQPTLIELSPPVKIVGDVHGQYGDLIRLFEMCGWPPSSNYLFLGDYVDRGKQSLETILLLLCYKIKYPENFFLLRGNHECANVTRVYGFYDECKRRCNVKIWKTFIDVFNCLPIAAIVASKIFCVHGGLSPSLYSMDDIRRISRPTDVPDYGLLNDLLWSDPSDTALDWEDNERGVSYCFGKVVLGEFLARYDFDLICRAHMVVEDGYEFWNDRTLVTIFSAPNYCGEFDNFGAVMSVSEDLLCAFELLKPLDGQALKKEMAKSKRRMSSLPPQSNSG